jgi:hypothetical protein
MYEEGGKKFPPILHKQENKMIQVSKKVFIRRKQDYNAFMNRNADTVRKIDTTFKIGSSLTKSGNINKGVIHDDEARYMPNIVNLLHTDPAFKLAVEDYWSNIAVYIPKGDGKEIEVGFMYKTEEDRAKGEADGTWQTKQQYGEPISIDDYLLYRYCLVYNRVANTIQDIDASNKIRFYLYTREEETATKYADFNNIKAATIKLLEILADRSMVKTLLYVYERADIEDTRDQDLYLHEEMQKDPTRFLYLAGDADLSLRSFIYKCLSNGLLTRQPNTEVIMIDDAEILSYTINGAIAELKTEKRLPLMTRLRAQLGGKYQQDVVADPMNYLTGNTKPSAPAPVITEQTPVVKVDDNNELLEKITKTS